MTSDKRELVTRAVQHHLYNSARTSLKKGPQYIIAIEKYVTDVLAKRLGEAREEITRDFDEASHLRPFWENYPPDDRGRAPIGDQIPWIEVGEHAVGRKLGRLLSKDFTVEDPGLPTGADERFLLSSPEISRLTGGLLSHIWLFVDIKSVGPRDDQDHTVLSHNQVSADGEWPTEGEGVRNRVLTAIGQRARHDFHASLPPLYVMSDGRVAITVIMAIKPVYSMLSSKDGPTQPLQRLDLATIPNGLLLTINPAYLSSHEGLLFPGKDDKGKDPRKLRSRVSFKLLRDIDEWRHRTVFTASG
jgi:hypothetical protein